MSDPLRLLALTGLPVVDPLIGRREALLTVLSALRSHQDVVISGPGGIGKSALAAACADAASDMTAEFPGGAVWVTCDHILEQADIGELWATVSRPLILDGVAAETDPVRASQALRLALAQRPRMLIILDHLDITLDLHAVRAALGVPTYMTLLITARQDEADESFTHLALGPLKATDALALLRQLAPTASDALAPREVMAATRGIPLAIHWAAAHLRRTGTLSGADQPPAPMPRDPARALARCFATLLWPDLAPVERTLAAALAALVQGPSLPTTAVTALAAALDASATAAPNMIATGVLQPLSADRLAFNAAERALLLPHWDALPAATRDHLLDAAIAFWLDYATAHPGFTGTEALEYDAAGIYGILDTALAVGRDAAARTIAQQIDYTIAAR